MVVNPFHARPVSTAQLDTGDVHVCHICLKQFSRRDLRERHRRRCEKSIGKIIPTKKRSCERCISFKVKCDYDKPSCSRCLGRSVPCEYKLEPRVKVPLNPAFSLGPNTTFSGSLDVFSVQDGHESELKKNGNALFDAQQQQNQTQLQLQQQHQLQLEYRHQHPHPHPQRRASVLAAPEMVFDLSSSSASTDTCSLGDGSSLDLDLVHPGSYTGSNDCCRNWSSSASTDTCSLGDGSSLDLDLVHPGSYTGSNDCYQNWSSPDSAEYGHAHGHAHHASQWDATTVWSDASSSLLDPIMLEEAVMESSWATNLLDPSVCMDAYDQHRMPYGQDFEQPISHHHARPGKHIGKSASLSY